MEYYYKTIEKFNEMVRLKLGNLDINVLPDTVIDISLYAPLAETQVKNRVPLWEEITQNLDNPKKIYFDTAIVVLCALKIYPNISSKGVKSHQTPTIKVEYNQENNISNFDLLAKEYMELIGIINDENNLLLSAFEVTDGELTGGIWGA